MSSLLQFVNFKDFDNWDVKQYIASLFKSKYQIISLKNYIQAETKRIKPFNYPNDSFKILGVNNKIGLFDNEIKKGKEINQAYKIVKNDFLSYNPYRINVGSIGLKTNKQKYDLISPAYVVFSCLGNLSPEYLFLIFKTNTFNQIIKNNTRGSVRQILGYDILENLKIPLPLLEIQQQLVKNYQDKINLVKEQQAKAEQLEADIETYLYQELGIEQQAEQENNDLLRFIEFQNIQRWDVSYLLNKNSIVSRYETITIGEIVDKFLQDEENHSLRLNPQQKPREAFKYIGMGSIEKETGVLLQYQEVKGTDIKSQAIKLPHGFFLYGKLRPYLNKYYYSNLHYNNVIVSSEFFVFSVKNINPVYFKFCLSSNFIQHQITNHMKGARMPRISETVFKSLKVPLPPLDIQNKIANHIQGLKNEIQELKQQAEQNQKDALSEFEAEIFDAS